MRAAIIINEISPSTDPEWIELYNDSSTPVDLFGYTLWDNNSLLSDDLSLTGTISAQSYLVFSRKEGWLTNGGDIVYLSTNVADRQNTVIDGLSQKNS